MSTTAVRFVPFSAGQRAGGLVRALAVRCEERTLLFEQAAAQRHESRVLGEKEALHLPPESRSHARGVREHVRTTVEEVGAEDRFHGITTDGIV